MNRGGNEPCPLAPTFAPCRNGWEHWGLSPTPAHDATRGHRWGRVGNVDRSEPEMRPGAMPKNRIIWCFPWCSGIRMGERQGVMRLAEICIDLPLVATKRSP